MKSIFAREHSIYKPAKASFFGEVNRALREHCIKSSEQIAMLLQYGIVPALISFWNDYNYTLFQLAVQIAQIFEENTIATSEIFSIPKNTYNRVLHQVIHFGYRNCNRYILKSRIISEGFLTAHRLFLDPITNHLQFPFNSKDNFASIAISIIEAIPEIPPEQGYTIHHYNLARFLCTYITLFSKHTLCYPFDSRNDLESCSLISSSLPIYMQFSPKDIPLCRSRLLTLLNPLVPLLDKFNVDGISQIQHHESNLFQNQEYISLMKMLFCCDPENYMETCIPQQVDYIFLHSGLNSNGSTYNFSTLLDTIETYVRPMYEVATNIFSSSDSTEYVIHFSEMLCNEKGLFPAHLISNNDGRSLFDYNENYLSTVWMLIKYLPRYVQFLATQFIHYYKSKLNSVIMKNSEENIQMLVAKINSLVDNDFQRHPSMVLARSSLFIPHQKDHELVGRARVLIEQAHNPSRMNYSIAELFDIVPFVKNYDDLFQRITEFVQNQLLAQISPLVDLESSLIDSMGQYMEAEYISPLQEMLREFSGRFIYDNKYRQKAKLPEQMHVLVLSNSRWKQIVQRGKLPFFHDFEHARKRFEKEFNKENGNKTLIWCDPSSVIEVQMEVNGRMYPFLFNGVQFSIVKMLLNGKKTFNQLIKEIHVEDLEEQLATLVESGLISNYPEEKEFYVLTPSLNGNRNYAKRFTSAENMAMMQMKDMDRRKAIECAIIKCIKKKKDGAQIQEIVNDVTQQLIKVFSADSEMIIEQVRSLEIKKFIAIQDKSANKFILIP